MVFRSKQSGLALIPVLLIMLVVVIVGVASVHVSRMGEMGVRSERDFHIALQAAEAALLDAQLDIEGLGATAGGGRSAVFTRGETQLELFVDGCGRSGDGLGLCLFQASGLPAWRTVDFDSGVATVEFGRFTGRSFPAAAQGLAPAKKPRYVIEALPEPVQQSAQTPKYLYRITAVGFGPREEIQAMVQIVYRN